MGIGRRSRLNAGTSERLNAWRVEAGNWRMASGEFRVKSGHYGFDLLLYQVLNAWGFA
jgi:hypothetical protein